MAPSFAVRWSIAIVGGLMVSQVLTLYTTPVVYLYLERFRIWTHPREVSAPGPNTFVGGHPIKRRLDLTHPLVWCARRSILVLRRRDQDKP